MSEMCECQDGCDCAQVPGPAALVVMRGGAVMKVCTRCHLTGDDNRVVYAIGPTNPPSQEQYAYDILGWFWLATGRFPSQDEVGGEA